MSALPEQKAAAAVREGQVLAEVWEDVVDVKELLLSLLISTVGALGGYIAAPNTPPYPLVCGLIGSVVAFVVCAVLFKPKRNLIDEEV